MRLKFLSLWVFLALGSLFVAVGMAQQYPGGMIQGCTNNDPTCNVGVTWYYQQATATPFPLVTASAAYQFGTYGKFTEIDDPNVTGGTRGHYVFMTGIGSGVFNPGLAEYNLQTNTLLGAATIDATFDTQSGSSQFHDFPGLIPGPNGEVIFTWGAISQGSKAGQFGSAGGIAVGTTYAAEPFKVVLPTASPSAVAGVAISYIPNAAASSEKWSTCWRIAPGYPAFANETMRCIYGGQAQKCKCTANNGAQVAMGNNQAGGVIHWTSTVGDFYMDTAGTPSPSPPPACTAAGLTKCFDPTAQTIGQATNSQLQFTSTPGDNDWRAWQLTAVTTSTAGSYAFPTLPSNGEFNAGTGCTVSFTTGSSETILQLANDIASMFNSHSLTTGNTPGADTANCIAQRVNYVVYVSTASTGKSNTCTSASPCLVLRLKGQQENATNCSGTYTAGCDIQTGAYQANLPGVSTCTSFCTVSGTMSIGNTHPTLFACKMLALWGQEAVCTNDVDHMTTSFQKSSMSGTGFGDAILLWCYGPKDYNTGTQQLTVGTCNLGGSRTTATVNAGNHVTNNNPANIVSPGLPSGIGATTSCASVSPYLIPNPSPTPTGFISFNCDLIASQDPDITSLGFPVSQAIDVTNMDNGNLLVVYEQWTGSTAPTLWGTVVDSVTGANDNTFQIASGDTLDASGSNFQVSAGTGASGTIYLAVTTGNTSAHGCGNRSCIIEYTAPPTNGNSPSFSFLQAINLGGSAATTGAPGDCPLDQVGGNHLMCVMLWGPFSSAANSTNLEGYDIYIP